MSFVINPSTDLVNRQSMLKALFPDIDEALELLELKSLTTHATGKTQSVTVRTFTTQREHTYVYNRIPITEIFGVRPVIRGTYAPVDAEGNLPPHLLGKWLQDKYSVDINFNAHLFEITQLSITEYELRATDNNVLVEGAVIFEYQHPLKCIFNDTVVDWSIDPLLIGATQYTPILDTDSLASAQKWTCPSLKLGVDPLNGVACHIHRTESSNQVNRIALPDNRIAVRIELRADAETPNDGYLAQCVLATGGLKTPRIEVSKEGLSVQSGEQRYYFQHDFTQRTIIELVVTDTYAVLINGFCVASDISFTDIPHAIGNFIITDFSESGFQNNHHFYFYGIDIGYI